MIYLERTITIANSSASIDEPIILYKGDRNVEIQFVLKNSPFRYKSSTNPTYGQLIINRENADSIFSDVSETVKGKILFVITGDMIDELNECGNYDFQIRLFNEDKTSRVTLMPIIAGITIREPICEDDEANKAVPYNEAYFDLKTNNKTNYVQLFSSYTGETLDVSDLDTSKATDMFSMFRDCSKLTTLEGLNNWDTSKVASMQYMFQLCESLTALDLSNFDTSNVTNMDSMFYECKKLTSLDLSNFDTKKVKTMSGMFRECELLTELDVSNFDTSKVTNMEDVFHNCTNLTSLDLSNFDTSNVTSMYSMFYYCKSLTTLDLSNFDTSNVTRMTNMFRMCLNLQSLNLSNFDTSNVTNMNYMLEGCNNLHTLRLDNCSNDTISKIITSDGFPTNAIEGVTRTIYCKKSEATGLTAPTNWVFSYVTEEEPEVPVDPPVEDIPLYVPGEFEYDTIVTEVRTMVDESHDNLSNMFNGCSNLVSVNTEDWDTSNVTDMSGMFNGCESLTSLDLSNFNTVFVWSMGGMFQGCTSLTTLNLSNWETASIMMPDMDMFGMFDNCTSLHTLRLDNCSNDTISKIIRLSQFPKNAISGVTRTIYCKESEATGLTPPRNWVFSFINN